MGVFFLDKKLYQEIERVFHVIELIDIMAEVFRTDRFGHILNRLGSVPVTVRQLHPCETMRCRHQHHRLVFQNPSLSRQALGLERQRHIELHMGR